MTPHTFVFIGRSGCGKGTQAELLIKQLEEKDTENSVFYLETGQKFRDFTSAEGYTNSLARSTQLEGGLQPSFLAVWIWSDILISSLKAEQHLIIDGTPRKLGEAIIFADAMKFYGRKPYIVYLNVAREWSEKRLSERHRTDDELSLVKRRLDWFDAEVMPAVEYFRTHDGVHFLDVDAERPIEEIHQDLMKRIEWQ